MAISHDEVIRRFAERAPNRSGEVEHRGSNVFCEGRTLYSYGRHFPLARYLGEVGGESLFVKNGDGYSVTTSMHQSMTQGHCPGPTLSREALHLAGVKFDQLEPRHFADVVEDTFSTELIRQDGRYYIAGEPVLGELPPDQPCGTCKGKVHLKKWGSEETYECYSCRQSPGRYQPPAPVLRYEVGERFEDPGVGIFIARETYDGGRQTRGQWHTLGSVLLRHNRRTLLCSLDESSYFIAELSERADTVADAFRSLKPQPVRDAENAGLEVRRQGEWFFVATSHTDATLAARLGCDSVADLLRFRSHVEALPRTAERSNDHEVRQVTDGPRLWCRGNVRHVHGAASWQHGSTGEHRMLRLGCGWWLAYRNTERRSWTYTNRSGARWD